MLTELTTALAVIVVAALAYYWTAWDYDYWKRKNVKGPKPSPFFGNTINVTFRKQHVTDFCREIYNQYPNEKVVGFYRYKNPSLLIRDPEIIKHIMIKDFDLFSERGIEASSKGLGHNLLFAESELWRALRSRFSAIFTSGKLKLMIPLMEIEMDKFDHYLQRKLTVSSQQDVYQLLIRFTSSNFGTCGFGIDVDMDSLDQSDSKLSRVNNTLLHKSIFSELAEIFPSILKKLHLPSSTPFISGFFHDLLKQIKEARGGVPCGRNDFMDMILGMMNEDSIQSSKNIKPTNIKVTDDLAAAQTFIFYAGGFDTTANTLAYLLHEISYRQDVQDKMVEEINRVLENHNNKPSFEAFKEMTYVTQVVDETLRMYPPVDPTLRKLLAPEYQLPGTDIVIEKGTILSVCSRAIHLDPKHYDNPQKFEPDRFSPENLKERNNYTYMPFGVGPRNCIGARFAYVSMRIFLTKALPKYKFLPVNETKKYLKVNPISFVLATIEPIVMKIEKRN